MIGDAHLQELAARAGQALLVRSLRLVSAESCTGGFIAKSLTDIPGSSHWFECGYVTYSNQAKIRDLGVRSQTLARHGAVSEAVALEMAAGALRVAGADVAIAVTGIAGPDGALPHKPVGTVWFASAILSAGGVEVAAERTLFAGDRDRVRRLSVAHALQMILTLAH
jgi:nicotinamide-nucleotide amidase